MKTLTEGYCAFCFKTAESDLNKLDETLSEMLEALLLNSNGAFTLGSLICIGCAENLRKAFKFRSNYSSLCPVINRCKKESMPSLKTCMWCKNSTQKNSDVSLKKILKETNIVDIFERHILKVTFIDIEESLLICGKCQISLRNFTTFIAMTSCLDALYIETFSTNTDMRTQGFSRETFLKRINANIFVEISAKFEVEVELNQEAEDNYDDFPRQCDIPKEAGPLEIDRNIMNEATTVMVQHTEISDVHENDEDMVFENQIEASVNLKLKNIDLKVLNIQQHFKCYICSYVTNLKYRLNRHRMIHKKLKLKVAKAVGITKYKTTKRLLQKRKESKKMYKCSFCSFKTIRLKSFRKHLLFRYSDLSKCSYVTNLKYRLTQHRMVDKKLKLKVPKSVGIRFSTEYKSTKNLSQKRRESKKMYKCRLCSFKTIRLNNFRKHMLFSHSNLSAVKQNNLITTQKFYKCEICKDEVKNAYCKKHMLTHKNPSETKAYNCELCEFKTLNKYNIQIHMKIHQNSSEIKLHYCQFCNFKTKYKSSLEKHHIRIHEKFSSDLPKYNYCTFQDRDKKKIKRHLILHGNYPKTSIFKCDECLYQTKSKPSLVKHNLTHTNSSKLRQFKGDQCSYVCFCSYCLENHKMIHKGSEPEIDVYKCKICIFKTKSDHKLQKHMTVHMTLKCEICNFKTNSEESLKLHTLNHKDKSQFVIYPDTVCSFQAMKNNYIKNDSNLLEMKTYRCKICNFETKHRKDLSKHKIVHRTPAEPKFNKRELCLYEKKSKTYEKRSETELDVYKCEICIFKTKSGHKLQRHMTVHMTLKCEICNFKTNSEKSFKLHTLNHKDKSQVSK